VPVHAHAAHVAAGYYEPVLKVLRRALHSGPRGAPFSTGS
jgi:hypothetical protein